jgi:hypothetical protein
MHRCPAPPTASSRTPGPGQLRRVPAARRSERLIRPVRQRMSRPVRQRMSRPLRQRMSRPRRGPRRTHNSHLSSASPLRPTAEPDLSVRGCPEPTGASAARIHGRAFAMNTPPDGDPHAKARSSRACSSGARPLRWTPEPEFCLHGRPARTSGPSASMGELDHREVHVVGEVERHRRGQEFGHRPVRRHAIGVLHTATRQAPGGDDTSRRRASRFRRSGEGVRRHRLATRSP